LSKKKGSFLFRLMKSQIIMISIFLVIFIFVTSIVFDNEYHKNVFQPMLNTTVESIVAYQENWNKMISSFQLAYRKSLNAALMEMGTDYENNKDMTYEELSSKLKTFFPVNLDEIDTVNWYVISNDGIIKATDYKSDLGLNIQELTPKYWQYLKEIDPGNVRIDPLLYEVRTGIPRLYGYYRMSDGSFFEIGIKLKEEIVTDFRNQFLKFCESSDYLENIDLYTIAYKPFGNFPELNDADKKNFKRAERNDGYFVNKITNSEYAVYITPYEESQSKISNPLVRSKITIDFEKSLAFKNNFLMMFNFFIIMILILVLLMNFVYLKTFKKNIVSIIKRIHRFAERPVEGIEGIEKNIDYKESKELTEAFKIMAFKISSLLKNQSSTNKRLSTAKERLEVLASHDELTGVKNRRTFTKEVKKLIENKNYPWTLIFVDVDNLKHINDVYGHAKGDEVLYEIGETLKSFTRSSDIAARLGGDEFVLVFVNTGNKDSMSIMKRIGENLKAKAEHLDIDFPLSVSYGLYTVEREEEFDVEEIIHIADQRMYDQKKRKGRNRE